MAISVKAETHVMVLHTTHKFVTANAHIRHTRTDNKNLNVLMIAIILGRCRASWGEPERCAWPVSNVHGISLQTDRIQIVLAKNRSSVLM